MELDDIPLYREERRGEEGRANLRCNISNVIPIVARHGRGINVDEAVVNGGLGNGNVSTLSCCAIGVGASVVGECETDAAARSVGAGLDEAAEIAELDVGLYMI